MVFVGEGVTAAERDCKKINRSKVVKVFGRILSGDKGARRPVNLVKGKRTLIGTWA